MTPKDPPVPELTVSLLKRCSLLGNPNELLKSSQPSATKRLYSDQDGTGGTTGDVPRPLGVLPGPTRGERSGQGDPEERVGALQAGFGLRVEQTLVGLWLLLRATEDGCTCTFMCTSVLWGSQRAWQRRRRHSAACSQSVEPNQPCLEKTTPHFLNYVPIRPPPLCVPPSSSAAANCFYCISC